jgi:uncharacterized membrane protein YukC
MKTICAFVILCTIGYAVVDEQSIQVRLADAEAAYAKKNYQQAIEKFQPLLKRLKMIQSDKYSHPYYWSPFILIGTK